MFIKVNRVKRKIAIIAVLVTVNLLSWAEFRIWTDKTGYALEAEFVTETGGQMVFRDREGRKYKINPEQLSEEDQRYLQTLLPPVLDINVSKKTSSSTRGSSKQGFIQCVVRIKKTNTRPYTGRLKAYLLVIGRQHKSDRYIVLNRAKKEFTLTRENKGQCEFKSGRIRINFDAYGKVLTEYSGYVVVVKDSHDNVIALKSSRPSFEKLAASLLAKP